MPSITIKCCGCPLILGRVRISVRVLSLLWRTVSSQCNIFFLKWFFNIFKYQNSFSPTNTPFIKHIRSFIHSVFCLTTGPNPPPKRILHIVRSRASSFKWEYPLLSLRPSSSFLRLLPRLLITSISPFIFPSITCFRRQFLRKMWPTQLAFRFLISCRISALQTINTILQYTNLRCKTRKCLRTHGNGRKINVNFQRRIVSKSIESL